MRIQSKYKTLWLSGILSLLSVLVYAAKGNETELSKTINESFAVNPDAKVEITNKYGEIDIETWDEDSVSVKVKITTFGKSDYMVEKLMKRVDVEFDDQESLIRIQTILDKKVGTISSFFNSIGDQSQALFSKSRIRIDYEVKIPEKANLTLENKYGDIFLEDFNSECRITLAHGNLEANNLLGETTLIMNFGEANINRLDEAYIELKGSNLEINAMSKLELKSFTSEIDIQEVDFVKMTSKSDKVEIGSLRSLEGQNTFTRLRIDEISDDFELDANFGSLLINKVSYTFSKMKIDGNSTDLQLTFQHPAYIETEIYARSEKLDLPSNEVDLDEKFDDPKEKYIDVTGFMGKPNASPSQLYIEAKGGDVEIDFSDKDAKSTRN